MGNREMINRINKELPAGGDMFSFLSKDLAPTDLQSLMMEVYGARAKRLSPKDVLNCYKTNRFVKPAVVSPVTLCEIDSIAYSLLVPMYTPLELSPLSPLGCASALAPVDQGKIVSTVRNAEVCSDMTNVLALECAVRRSELLKKDKHSLEYVRLCASSRQVRAQPFSSPNSFAHFRVFGLCTAGHDEGNYAFEQNALKEHITLYLSLLRALAGNGFGIVEIGLETILYDSAYTEMESCVRKHFEDTTGQAVSMVERLHQNYYQGVGFHIYATNKSGEKLFLADGGFTDWTQKLLGNKKERLLTSGIGTERLAYCFADNGC